MLARAGLLGALAASSLVMAAGAIVAAGEPKGKLKVRDPAPAALIDTAPLPAAVQEMVDGIRAAVQSGKIEDLRTPLDWNELKPAVSNEKIDDAIAYWKKISGDGEGREILAIMGELLDAGRARLAIGKDPENTSVLVWPYLAELPLDKLTPAQEVELYRLVPPAEARAMREKKKWTWYRLAIGADGTWHSFMRHE